MFKMFKTLLVAGFLSVINLAAFAQTRSENLIVFSIDVSNSVTEAEYATIVQGYSRAVVDERVLAAVDNQPFGSIDVQVIMWSSGSTVMIERFRWNRENAGELSRRFATMTRPEGNQTALFRHLHGVVNSPVIKQYSKVTIDVQSDGLDNYGNPGFRNNALPENVTINSILIPNLPANDEELQRYYENFVKSPDGFVIVAENWNEFAEALIAKMVFEMF